MKLQLSILLIFLFAQGAFAQIKNGDFESWDIEDDELIMSDWKVYSPAKSFSRTEASYAGEWALYVNPDGSYDYSDHCGATHISQTVDISGYDAPFYLEFYSISKSLKNDSFSYVSLLISYYNVNESNFFQFRDTSSVYQKRQLLVDPSISDSVFIMFRLGAVVTASDICAGQSEIWIDDIRFNTTVDNSDEQIKKYRLAPNPFANHLRCYDCPRDARYVIYNMTGSIVQRGTLDGDMIQFVRKGMHFFRLEESFEVHKIISY